jgi:hypothetical protein
MQEPDTSESPYYRVEQEGDSYSVQDAKGRTILSCRDQGSASHYAVLLNEAFAQGVRAAARARRGAG